MSVDKMLLNAARTFGFITASWARMSAAAEKKEPNFCVDWSVVYTDVVWSSVSGEIVSEPLTAGYCVAYSLGLGKFLTAKENSSRLVTVLAKGSGRPSAANCATREENVGVNPNDTVVPITPQAPS
eukprot:Opistho-2@26407